MPPSGWGVGVELDEHVSGDGQQYAAPPPDVDEPSSDVGRTAHFRTAPADGLERRAKAAMISSIARTCVPQTAVGRNIEQFSAMRRPSARRAASSSTDRHYNDRLAVPRPAKHMIGEAHGRKVHRPLPGNAEIIRRYLPRRVVNADLENLDHHTRRKRPRRRMNSAKPDTLRGQNRDAPSAKSSDG